MYAHTYVRTGPDIGNMGTYGNVEGGGRGRERGEKEWSGEKSVNKDDRGVGVSPFPAVVVAFSPL